jgi:hypothetical protein
MSDFGNKKKAAQLGMSPGNAAHKLRKMLLFRMIQMTGTDSCFQCGEKIENVDDFSIDHKVPWLDSDNPVGLFFDLNNIAFSHINCNRGAARVWNKGIKAPHGTKTRYNTHGCRCDECREAKRLYDVQRRTRTAREVPAKY